MPTLTEELATSNAKLDALLTPEPTPTPAPEPLELSTQEVLEKMSAELANPLSVERGKYLSETLSTLSKGNWEGKNTFIPLPEKSNPDMVKPGTEKIAPIGTLASSAGDTHWSYNLKTVMGKAQLITDVVRTPAKIPEFIALIEKSALTDSFDDIKSMFGITDEDLKDEYSVRWKIGDAVSALQTAIKVERITAKAKASKSDTTDPTQEKPLEHPNTRPEQTPAPNKDGEKQTTDEPAKEKPEGDPPNEQPSEQAKSVWPKDMAAEKLDAVTKGYKPKEPTWGYDKQVSRR